MAIQTYESVLAGQPTFRIELDGNEYVFAMRDDEWRSEGDMDLVANMLVKTFDLAAFGHKNVGLTFPEMAVSIRDVLTVPMEAGMLWRDGRGLWCYSGPIYDKAGELVTEPSS